MEHSDKVPFLLSTVSWQLLLVARAASHSPSTRQMAPTLLARLPFKLEAIARWTRSQAALGRSKLTQCCLKALARVSASAVAATCSATKLWKSLTHLWQVSHLQHKCAARSVCWKAANRQPCGCFYRGMRASYDTTFVSQDNASASRSVTLWCHWHLIQKRDETAFGKYWVQSWDLAYACYSVGRVPCRAGDWACFSYGNNLLLWCATKPNEHLVS